MYDIVKLELYIRANSAESGPPLGTTLGNIGVNTIKFCKEFNDYTQDLPNYFLLKVNITVLENRTFTFIISLPPVGFLIYLLKKEEVLIDPSGTPYSIYYVVLEDFLQLCKFIFPNYRLEDSSKILKGTLLSSNIIIKL